MADLKYQPVVHDHQAFLARASRRKGFAKAYDALELEYQLAKQMLKARARAGLTQDVVAQRMGTTKAQFPDLNRRARNTHHPSLRFSVTRKPLVAICR